MTALQTARAAVPSSRQLSKAKKKFQFCEKHRHQPTHNTTKTMSDKDAGTPRVYLARHGP